MLVSPAKRLREVHAAVEVLGRHSAARERGIYSGSRVWGGYVVLRGSDAMQTLRFLVSAGRSPVPPKTGEKIPPRDALLALHNDLL